MKTEGQVRIPSGCAIAAMISRDGNKMSGETITNAMKPMHDRSNGLGGGFAGYGIYPEYKDFYAFHMFFDSRAARKGCEAFLKERFEIVQSEIIPTRKTPLITDEPIIWRYFVAPLKSLLTSMQLDEKEYVVRTVIIGIFYKLDEYEGYSWTAHGRYPTNTPGWWGGAHPFALLDSSVVHNGEISSYDANRRFMEMFGYKCTLQTDTEVITYILDYLLRRQNLTLGEAASVIAAPFWSTIAAKTDLADQKKHTYLRTLFPSLLITGPFSIVFGFNGGLMALNDRLKLRSMVVGEKKDMVYIASEETAIRAMEPDAENIWAPAGGEPVIVTVKEGVLL